MIILEQLKIKFGLVRDRSRTILSAVFKNCRFTRYFFFTLNPSLFTGNLSKLVNTAEADTHTHRQVTKKQTLSTKSKWCKSKHKLFIIFFCWSEFIHKIFVERMTIVWFFLYIFYCLSVCCLYNLKFVGFYFLHIHIYLWLEGVVSCRRHIYLKWKFH